MANIVGLIILSLMIAAFVGLIVLQVKLSKKEAVMPGLILPIISFVFALLVVIAFVLNMAVTEVGGAVETISGTKIIAEEIQVEVSETEVSSVGFAFIPVFAVNVIPCIVYLLIYFVCHPFKKKRAEIDKMSISDL